MTSKHITRDYSAHKKSIYRPYGEYCKLEIFSYDPIYTREYLVADIKNISNATRSSYRSWACLSSADMENDIVVNIPYLVKDDGEYRLDVIYEQSNHIYKDKSKNTGSDLIGNITISKNESIIYDKDTLFDGENNILKRIIHYQQLNQGNHNFIISIPPNCYFYGVIIRKIKKYIANNEYGQNSNDTGDMMLTSATVTISDMTKPSELKVEVGYDDAFECFDSPSGFYMDYMDEVNFYVKDNDGQIERVFGGYISSILPDDDRTKLSIHCADRLRDGQNKYILDEMALGGGTKSQSEDDYTDGMTKNFNTYGEALKYLCDIHEVTLKSNISPNFLVDGEKYSKGVQLIYGKSKAIKSIPTTNGYSKASNNFIEIRNKPSSSKQQVWTLYDASKYAKVPPAIYQKSKTGGEAVANYGYIHLTYGLGSPKTEIKTKTTETVDVADTTVGSQKFGKCGVSHDKKYVMAIGKPSIGRSKIGSYNYNTIYKTIFVNKCPRCGKATLRWDSARSDTHCITCGGYHGSKRTWGDISETEVSCNSCCSDFDAVTGYEKDGAYSSRLTTATKPVKSSVAEQNKLHKGQMVAVPKTGIEVSSDDILKKIATLVKKYHYKLGGSSTASGLKKTGYGDCHAFSELIFNEFKKYKVSAKIVQYPTNYSSTHQSVMYVNSSNKWVDYPYEKYGITKMLHNTSKSRTGHVVQVFKGTNIGNVKTTGSTSKSQTTTITTTKNYDKDKPFQGYLKITYSNTQSFKAKQKTVYAKFTYDISSDGAMGVGFTPYWVNNTIKKATLKNQDGSSLDIVKWIHQVNNSEEDIYLRTIQMIAPVRKATKENEDVDWYKYDKSTIDESSCKMRLYQIVFNDDKGTDPSELNSCGKTIQSMMQDLVKDTGYLVDMTYGEHRKDDRINFRVNNNSSVVYNATEGDNNNILSWNSISYSPVSSLYNSSVQVFKKTDTLYYYVDSRNPNSILNYGEQTTLQTSNQPISNTEAYYNARMNEKYNSEQTYNFTITVPNYPDVNLGDLVKVTANAKKLNTIKELQSIKITFDYSKMPRIRTELGLGELAPDLQLKKNIRLLRDNAKKDTTSFSSSAIPVDDADVYIWDR